MSTKVDPLNEFVRRWLPVGSTMSQRDQMTQELKMIVRSVMTPPDKTLRAERAWQAWLSDRAVNFTEAFKFAKVFEEEARQQFKENE